MDQATQILDEVKKAVVGKDDVVLKTLLAILAGGHILLEDKPGVGKTTMALAFSRALSLNYGRMQFTPDVLPSDITGFSVYNRQTGTTSYQAGAILCNLFLADELNRASSRTQSALLEAMEEGQITVDGVTHPLPQPFTVIATQNPTGASGTQLLPDSQLDRFMVRLSMGYPTQDSELELLRRKQNGNALASIVPVVTQRQLQGMQAAVAAVYTAEDLLKYVVNLVTATRSHPDLVQGASPRASVSVAAMARAVSWAQGRDYVIPADVSLIFVDTVAHRLTVNREALQAGKTAVSIAASILKHVPAPRLKRV